MLHNIEDQEGIKFGGSSINELRYADDTKLQIGSMTPETDQVGFDRKTEKK